MCIARVIPNIIEGNKGEIIYKNTNIADKGIDSFQEASFICFKTQIVNSVPLR